MSCTSELNSRKILTPITHGLFDYGISLVFAMAPMLFEMDDISALIAYMFACAHLLVTLLTHFRMGVVKVITFKIHGMIENVAGITLLIIPYVFSLDRTAIFFVFMGLIILMVNAITNYKCANVLYGNQLNRSNLKIID